MGTRRTVYGDICQSMSGEELKQVLVLANNDMKKAIDIITIHVGDDQNFSPPVFFEEGTEKFKPKSFKKHKVGEAQGRSGRSLSQRGLTTTHKGSCVAFLAGW